MKNPFMSQEEEIDPVTGLPKAPAADVASLLAPAAPQAPSMSMEREMVGPPAPAMDQAKPEVNVRDYLMKKYGLDSKYSDESRDKTVKDNEIGMGQGLMAALSAIGAGFQGKDSGAAASGMLGNFRANADKKISQFDAGRNQALQNVDNDRKLVKEDREDKDYASKNDPASELSVAKREAFKNAYGMELPETMSAAKLDELSPALSKKIDMDFRKQELNERMKDRQLQRESMQYNRDQVRNEKQATKDEKKKTTLNEIEDRRTNIEDNLSNLERMIKEKGTFEAFGSHNQDMDRLTDQIATDMAKLTDPNSVARPSEVEMFKKGLVQSGFSNKNSTALDVLKNFRGEVNKRAENAYKIRGFDNPGSQADKGESQETKVMNGKTYRKVPGGWEEVE